jgi:putative endonuclease
MTVAKGRLGENLAVTYLEELGYRILERNFRYSRIGEIDIIAQEGDEVVFVEVKLTQHCFSGIPRGTNHRNQNKPAPANRRILVAIKRR